MITNKNTKNRTPGSGTASGAALVPLEALPKFDRHNTYCWSPIARPVLSFGSVPAD
jgi:hypothetical protein